MPGVTYLENLTVRLAEGLAALLETFRTPDGGYGKGPDSPAGSTYHTFLVGLCYQLLGRSLAQPERIVQFLQSRRREDGGFVEIAPMRRSGTNPTAAAIGMLQLLEQEGSASPLTPELRAGVVAFLAEMPSFEGGMRANARAPLADLLSTFTATWTLDQLGAAGRIDTASVLNYAQSVEAEAGGFHGGVWDEGVDVEYTFYGLGVLALLS